MSPIDFPSHPAAFRFLIFFIASSHSTLVMKSSSSVFISLPYVSSCSSFCTMFDSSQSYKVQVLFISSGVMILSASFCMLAIPVLAVLYAFIFFKFLTFLFPPFHFCLYIFFIYFTSSFSMFLSCFWHPFLVTF